MKKLLFTELSLLSQIEKKAFQTKFSPKSNLIIGKNDTGKSSLIKSLFRVFGAESKNHPRWQNANVTILLRFKIDGEAFAILRYGRLYSVFNSKDELLGTFNSVTKELSPFLAKLFDFKLILPNKQGETITPPPAYFFLPFYIDQDKGWVSNWNSFEQLGQIPRWRINIAEYHTGIRPNEYYELINKSATLKSEISDLTNELRVQENVFQRIDKSHKESNFDIDTKAFEKEIESLLFECEKLKIKEDALKATLSNLYNTRFHLEAQVKLVKGTYDELNSDFEFANKKIDSDVECPICGAIYENSFSERFAIAQDENRCYELLQQLKNDIVEVNKKISNEKLEFEKTTIESERIREILNVKKSDVRLHEIIEVEGKKEVRNILTQDIRETQGNIVSSENNWDDLRKKLKGFNKTDKRKQILTLYMESMRAFLFKLGVHNLDEKSYKKIDAQISEIGSDNPRALLAYFYSILKVMGVHSSSVFAPIVIDSPNQQDQDNESLLKMMQFIKDFLPVDHQLILATADIGREIPFDGNRIVLSNKDSLLNEEMFQKVLGEMSTYLNKSLLHD